MKYEIRAMIEGLAKHDDLEKAKTVLNNFFEELIKLMDSRDYLEVLDKKIEKPESVEEGFLSGFVEVTVGIKDFSGVLGFIIDFGPTSIELLKPEDMVEIDAGDLEGVLNDLIAKIQHFDKSLKIITSKYIKLQREFEKKK